MEDPWISLGGGNRLDIMGNLEANEDLENQVGSSGR